MAQSIDYLLDDIENLEQEGGRVQSAIASVKVANTNAKETAASGSASSAAAVEELKNLHTHLEKLKNVIETEAAKQANNTMDSFNTSKVEALSLAVTLKEMVSKSEDMDGLIKKNETDVGTIMQKFEDFESKIVAKNSEMQLQLAKQQEEERALAMQIEEAEAEIAKIKARMEAESATGQPQYLFLGGDATRV